MAVEFHDYSIKVKGTVSNAINGVLEECAGELESAAKRNSRVDTGQTKNSFQHKVDTSTHVASIGSNLENAIWEEFGTGEYALGKNGRKGYWVFVKGSSGGSKNSGKTYTLAEAKKVMAILRSKGLEAYYTNGKKPSRAFWHAFNTNKNKIINRIQESMKGL
jgi:HK97 gp10 family phage protein